MNKIIDRQKTHGSWPRYAEIAQELRGIVGSKKRALSWRMCASSEEAIEALLGKLARALSGDQYFDDHWDDMVGYAARGKEFDSITYSEISALASIPHLSKLEVHRIDLFTQATPTIRAKIEAPGFKEVFDCITTRVLVPGSVNAWDKILHNKLSNRPRKETE